MDFEKRGSKEMSQTKSNHLAEIVSMMRLYNISLNDIDSYKKSQPKPLKETSRFILFLAYLGGLLVLGGLGVFLKDHWDGFSSTERIVITYGVGVSLYFAALALYYKKTSTLTLSNLFVIAFVFQWGGLGVALKEFFPDGDNIPLFILSISGVMFLQTGVTFIKVRLASILFMTLLFLSIAYGAFVTVLFKEVLLPLETVGGLPTSDLLAVLGALSLMLIVQQIQKTQYNVICGVWFFVAMLSFYLASYYMLWVIHMTDFFGLFVFFGLALSQGTRSKAMLTLTAIALCGYLVDITLKYFLNTPWWPLALVSLGLLIILTATLFYRKAQNFR